MKGKTVRDIDPTVTEETAIPSPAETKSQPVQEPQLDPDVLEALKVAEENEINIC